MPEQDAYFLLYIDFHFILNYYILKPLKYTDDAIMSGYNSRSKLKRQIRISSMIRTFSSNPLSFSQRFMKKKRERGGLMRNGMRVFIRFKMTTSTG